MRNIVVTEFLSLDGVMEEPAWTSPYWNEEIAEFKHEELFTSDTLLLGRITYQGFAEAWPSRTDEVGFADRINNMPKYVVSTTLNNLEWNNSHLIKENVVEEIKKLKEQSGKDILVYGSSQLIQSLMENNLVNCYRLLIYPVVLGNGKRLFKDGADTKLKLIDTQAFSSGVVAFYYQKEDK